MKYKISKEDFAKLSEDAQKLYKASGDDYVMAIDGLPDYEAQEERIQKMDKKVNDLLDEKKDQKRKADEADEARKQAELDANKKKGDVDAIEASWQEKYDKKVDELTGTNDTLRNTVSELTSGAQATRLASELAIQGSADALMPHISGRLKTEFDENGQPKVTVLGTDGKPSALTLDELKTELKTNKALAPLMIGSKAGGAGHQQSKGGGAAGETRTRDEFNSMNDGERQAFFKDGGAIADE